MFSFMRCLCLSFLVIGLAGKQGLGLSKEYFSVLPFTHVGVSPQGGIKTHFFLPCGTEYVGMVMRPDRSFQQSRTVRMAVLVRQLSLTCMGLPKPHTKTLMSFSKVRRVLPMKIPMGRVSYGIARTLDITRANGRDRGVSIVFEKPCGAVFGSVFSEANDGSLGMGVLYGRGLGKKKPCPYGQDSRTASYLSPASDTTVRPLTVKPQDIEKAYYLRLIAVRSVRKTQSGILAQYRARCNEAPIGLVLRRRRNKRSLGVGMVVARLFNRDCKSSGRWATYDLQGLKIDSPILAMQKNYKLGGSSRLTVTRPKNYGVETHSEQKRLKLRFTSACRSPLGVLYGKDYANHLSIGVLQLERFGSCENPNKSYAVTQPVFPVAAQSSKIYPMQLSGFRYF